MSFSQTSTTPFSSQASKKFLKKGEGLKRFAAYNPPLPVVTNKVQRRQTFVKFKLDNKTKKEPSNIVHPDILYDDSINLSTEIPKIAPPKIMYTPVRPVRRALGTLKESAFNCYDDFPEEFSTPKFKTPYRTEFGEHCAPKIPSIAQKDKLTGTTDHDAANLLHDKNLTRKVTSIQASSLDRMISFEGFRKPATPSPPVTSRSPVAQSNQDRIKKTATPEHQTFEEVAPKRYNLRGCRRQNTESLITTQTKNAPKKEPKRSRRQMKAIVERHIPQASAEKDDVGRGDTMVNESQIKGNIDNLLKKIEEKKTSLVAEQIDDYDDNEKDAISIRRAKDKYSPAFDLSTPTPGSCILALGQQIHRIQSTVDELKDKIKNCKCGAYLANAQKQPPTGVSSRKTSKAREERMRPLADADNPTSTVLNSLVDEIAQLRARFDDINVKKRI